MTSGSVTIRAIGGYQEIGKNMTVIESGNEAVILDMGLYMDKFITFQDTEEGEDIKSYTSEKLISEGAIPDDRAFFKSGKSIKAIILGHCHLDHIGAVRFLAGKYKCPIIASPYTLEILGRMAKDDHWELQNRLVPLNLNSTYRVSKNFEVELVYVTHSALQCAITVIHTPAGPIVYTLDFKFDNSPTIGQKTNMTRLKQLKGALGLVVDCTRITDERHTFSESIAKDMLGDVLMGLDHSGHAIIVTTFASHLPRFKSIIDFGRKLGREVVLVGRSISRYVGAAEDLGLVNFTDSAKMVSFAKQRDKLLNAVNNDRGKYLLIVTGNQGEPNSVLSRMAKGETPFQFVQGDFVIFSCTTIPTPIIEANRRSLEQKLKSKSARIFKDVHCSGHAGKEDLRDLIELIKPKHIIPGHGDLEKLSKCVDLSTEEGYALGKNIHLLQNGQSVDIK